MTILAMILTLAGVFFLTVSCVGLLRLPDFFSRAHAVGKSETLGAMLILSGLAVYNGWEASTAKILFILIFVLITTPAAIHVLGRAALVAGHRPWTRESRALSPGSGGFLPRSPQPGPWQETEGREP